MTVAELIAKLQTQPQDMGVLVEGCDCAEHLLGISMFDDGGRYGGEMVVIRRAAGVYDNDHRDPSKTPALL